MQKRWRRASYLAGVGFVLNAALFTYAELTDYALFPPVLRIVSAILCPASILGGFLFFDLNAHSGLMVAAWTFLGLMNAAIYCGVCLLAARFIWRSDEHTS
jgi:hypothetical protein